MEAAAGRKGKLMYNVNNTLENQLSKTRDGLQWSNVRDAQCILLAFPSAGEPFATIDAATGRKAAKAKSRFTQAGKTNANVGKQKKNLTINSFA